MAGSALAASEAPSIAATARHGRVHPADGVFPVAIGLWALGLSRVDINAVGPYGLPTALPIVFYAGVALLVVSAALELARAAPSAWRMALHAAALVVMLFGTAPLLYPEGRYAWLYKTIGVVQYINAHGQLDSNIDIYQNWPGFFAVTGWFDKVAGIASPLAYAKWAQLFFELAALPLLYLIYKGFSLTPRQRWIAMLLYSASNWIGQDYFSPQGLGVVLELGIMALAANWLFVGGTWRYPAWTRWLRISPPRSGNDAGVAKLISLSRDGGNRTPESEGAHGWALASQPKAARAAIYALIMLAYFVLTFTHELSPYLVAAQLGSLALFKLIRPRWLPLALAAIAVGYLIPHFSYVYNNNGLFHSLFTFFSNVTPPAFSVGTVPSSQVFIERSAMALSLLIWAAAVVGAWLRRRGGPHVIALFLLCFSPIAILFLQAYGHEGILRVYLFSLPWATALIALLLVPATSPGLRPSGSHRARRAGPRRAAGLRTIPWDAVRAPLALAGALALFFPAFFGDDSFNTMSRTEVVTLEAFLEEASPGPIYCAINNAPLADTAKYALFPLQSVFNGVAPPGPINSGIADVITNDALRHTNGREPVYVIIAPSMMAYSNAYGYTSPGSYSTLMRSLAASPEWKLIFDRSGVVIYEMPPLVTPTAGSG